VTELDSVANVRHAGDFAVEVFDDPVPGHEVCWEVCSTPPHGLVHTSVKWAGVGGWAATEAEAVAAAVRHGGTRRVVGPL
jgi:hypothetical protein